MNEPVRRAGDDDGSSAFPSLVDVNEVLTIIDRVHLDAVNFDFFKVIGMLLGLLYQSIDRVIHLDDDDAFIFRISNPVQGDAVDILDGIDAHLFHFTEVDVQLIAMFDEELPDG